MAFAAMIPLALQAASAAAGLLGGISAASAAESQGAYQAAIARNEGIVQERNARAAEADAKIALENARRAGLAGQIEAQDQDFAARRQIDEQAGEFAITGLRGSGQERALTFMQQLAGRDRARIVEGSTARAAGFRQQGQDFITEAADRRTASASSFADAEMAGVNASASASQSRLAGFSSLLSGFAGGGEILLDGSRRQSVIDSFNNTFRRRTVRYR